MPITTLIDGLAVAEFDGEITAKLSMETGSMKDVRAERMQVGVRNAKGEIYRAIGISGLTDFMGAIGRLTDMGLVDELKDYPGSKHGYDAIFSA